MLVLVAGVLLACQGVATAPVVDLPSTVQPHAAPADNWKSYTHKDFGVSFRYPADWQVEETPIGVTLAAPRIDGSPAGNGSIILAQYTISAGADLQDWVQIYSRFGEHPSLDGMTTQFADTTAMPFAAVGDQVVYAVQDSPLMHTEIVWIAKDGFVFRIGDLAAPEVRYVLAEITASLQFDEAMPANLGDSNRVAGDEAALLAAMARAYGLRLEEAQTAIRNSKADPPPVQAAAVYTGASPYGDGYPGFTVTYDSAEWSLVQGEGGEWDRLEHSQLDACVLYLQGGATETYDARWRQIGGQWWIEARLNEEVLLYSVDGGGASYIFGITVAEEDPLGEGLPCKRAAEQVLGTLAVGVE
jgi:hypothetical protein